MTFGSLIKSCRENRGWSLRTVAEKMNNTVTFTTVEAWEKGKHQPRLNHAADLARIYNISLDTVMGLNNGTAAS